MKNIFRLLVLIILAVLAVIPVSQVSQAKDKSLTISWTQTLPAPNDLKGWKIYYSETAGGPYKELVFVPFKGVQATYSYESGRAIGKLGNKKARMYFVIRAVDEEGNVGAASTEASVQVDGEKTKDVTPPAAPGNVVAEKK